MKIAFKKHSQNPDNSTGMSNLPWISAEINDEEENHYLDNNWSVLTKDQYYEYMSKYSYESVNYNIKTDNSKLRIIDLVHPNFRFNDPSKIDFTIHLQTGVLLKKEVTMLKNGRPSIAKYYHPVDGSIVAEIKYIFVDNDYKFMIHREEWLGYYNREGAVPNYYLIHKRDYDFTKLTQATESMNERVTARGNIINEIKIVLNNMLAKYYVSQGNSPQNAATMAIVAGKSFFDAYRFDISDFTEIASNSFKLGVASDTTFNFLDCEVAPGLTARAYVTDRLTY